MEQNTIPLNQNSTDNLGTGRTGGRNATKGVIHGSFALSVGKPDKKGLNNWEWTLLGDVAQLESGHTPSRKHPEYWDGDIPWIGIKDAVDNHGRIIFDTYQHVTNLGLANSSARLLPKNTVCLSRTASIGYVVVMGKEMATSQDFVNWVCGPKLTPLYLKYILMAEKKSLFRFASGTTHQTIYYPEAKAFSILLPPLPTQKAIAHILGTLDDKIELNRRMNETLESIARAIFTSWFIDFDPVRAKAEGRQPEGMDAATAALFPSEFEEVEGQEIPKGWKISQLSDIIRVNEKTIGLDYCFSKINYIDISSVNVGKLENITEYCLKERPSRAQRIVNHGDTIWSCVRPNRRSYLYISNPHPNTIVSTGFAVLTPKKVPSSYVFFSTTTDFFIEYLTNNADGSAYPAVKADHFSKSEILLPSQEILISFHNIVNPLLEKISFNEKESNSLSSIRDTLLPKLLSGELPIENPENFIEATA